MPEFGDMVWNSGSVESETNVPVAAVSSLTASTICLEQWIPRLLRVLLSFLMVSYCLCAAVEALQRQSKALDRRALSDLYCFNISLGSSVSSSDFPTIAE